MAPELNYALLAAAGLLAVFFLLLALNARTRVRGVEQELLMLSKRIERQKGEHRKEVAATQRNIETLAREIDTRRRLFVILLDLAKELGASTDRADIYALLVRSAHRLAEAQEVELFQTRPARTELSLAAHIGLPSGIPPDVAIPIGEGYIGYTAQKRLPMTIADFRMESNLAQREIESPWNQRFRTDICIPLTYRDRIFGVINVGGLAELSDDVKSILVMIGSLGAMALENSRLFHEIQAASETDDLTRLLNRRSALDVLRLEIERSLRYDRASCLIILDIDHFRQYNEVNGRPSGDDVLRQFAVLLRDQLRNTDYVGRYGGEEFIVVLPETEKEIAARLAERIRQAVQDEPFSGESSVPGGCLTVSIGLAACPVDAVDVERMVSMAERALYQAKHEGRNRVVIASRAEAPTT